MAVNASAFHELTRELTSKQVTLVAVSKTKPVSDIQALYELGQRDFGENYVQELTDKQPQLPADVRWHFIGHLQSNKVKYIAPFVHLIHGVDSLKLLKEIAKQAAKLSRTIEVLLQVHIAQEETKFGLDEQELNTLIGSVQESSADYTYVRIRGLMGMASFTENQQTVRKEFDTLHALYQQVRVRQLPQFPFDTLSMGMSSDYALAIAAGSNMVRIGSLLFGARPNTR